MIHNKVPQGVYRIIIISDSQLHLPGFLSFRVIGSVLARNRGNALFSANLQLGGYRVVFWSDARAFLNLEISLGCPSIYMYLDSARPLRILKHSLILQFPTGLMQVQPYPLEVKCMILMSFAVVLYFLRHFIKTLQPVKICTFCPKQVSGRFSGVNKVDKR